MTKLKKDLKNDEGTDRPMASTNIWLKKHKRKEIREKVADAILSRRNGMGIGKVGNWKKVSGVTIQDQETKNGN